jgi:hypothetical protein
MVGRQELEILVKSAPYFMEVLQRQTALAAAEKNTQAKSAALAEVVQTTQECYCLFSALALMKNCRFIDYDVRT